MSYGITDGVNGIDSSTGIENYMLIQESKTRMAAAWSAPRKMNARFEIFSPDVGEYVEIEMKIENSLFNVRTRGKGTIDVYNLVNTATTNPPSDNYGLTVYNNNGLIFSSAIKPLLVIDAIYVPSRPEVPVGTVGNLLDKTYPGETKLGISIESMNAAMYPHDLITLKVHHVSPGRIKITFTRTAGVDLYESYFNIVRAY